MENVVVPVAYKWEEGGDPDISITFSVPSGTQTRDLEIECTTTTILAGLKNQPPIIEGLFVIVVFLFLLLL